MTLTVRRALVAAMAVAFVAGGSGAASAGPLAPVQGATIDLGRGVHGTIYYVPDERGAYRLVATLDAGADSTPVRFTAVIADGQDIELSTPREAGQPAQTVLIHRTGDRVSVSGGGGGQRLD